MVDIDIQLNEWESTFFGRKIGRILLKNVPNRPLAIAHFDGFDLVQAKIPASDTALLHYLQQQQFHFIEGELQLSLPLSAPYYSTLVVATQADLAELCCLFGTAFPHSRFRPPYFSAVENQRFYSQWIANAVQGIFDDLCFVERQNGQIAGAVSLRLVEHQAQIGLLAVAKGWQGKGVGQRLLNGAIGWAKQQGATSLTVRTQSANLPAIRLYQRFGATVQDLHYWLYRNGHSF